MSKRVAVTGGVACGKSSLCHIFHNLGAFVVSADQIVSQLFSLKHPVTDKVIDLLGKGILSDGVIDKEKIAKVVFNDSEKLFQLEGLLHPIVNEEIQKQLNEASSKNYPLLVAEVPLLFESGSEKLYDVTVAVLAREEIAKLRYQKKDFLMRQGRLIPNQKKRELADYTIENNGTEDELFHSAQKLFNILTS